MFRSRWAAVGAAVAVTLGAGGVSLTQAAISTGEKPVYVALDAPCRVVDTRPGGSNIGPKATPIGAGDAAAYTIQITGANGDCTGGLAIPADAVAVATNVTVIQPNGAPSGRSFFTVYPTGAPRPTTSNLNFVNGQAPTPNKVDVGIGAGGKITIYNNEGTAHAAVDIFGYYIDHNHDDRYYTEAEIDTALAAKANTADVYTKGEIDGALDAKLDAPARLKLGAVDFQPSTEGSWRLDDFGWRRVGSFDPECIVASASPPPGSTVDGITLAYAKQGGLSNVTIDVAAVKLVPPVSAFGTTRSIAQSSQPVFETSGGYIGISVPVTSTAPTEDEIVVVEICTAADGLFIWSVLIDLS